MEMAHADADLAVARAAASLGVPYTLSNQASVPMEEVRDAAPGGSRLFQLYWSASDELNASLLRRAEASGCEAIVVTLDTHLLGWRTRDLDLAYLPFTRGLGIAQYTSDPVFQQLVRERARGRLRYRRRLRRRAGRRRPVKLTPKAVAAGITIARKGAALTGAGLRESLRSPLPRAAVETFLDVFSTPALTWDDLAKAREWTTLPIILKGIVHPDDAPARSTPASTACGSRTTAGARSTSRCRRSRRCPTSSNVSGGRVPIVFDSGVRQGVGCRDRPRARRHCRRDRPAVRLRPRHRRRGRRRARCIRNILAELDITLGLAGCTSIGELGRDTLRESEPPPAAPCHASQSARPSRRLRRDHRISSTPVIVSTTATSGAAPAPVPPVTGRLPPPLPPPPPPCRARRSRRSSRTP